MARCLHNLAIGYGDVVGDQEEKMSLLQQSLAIKERCFGAAHPEVAVTLANLVRAPPPVPLAPPRPERATCARRLCATDGAARRK